MTGNHRPSTQGDSRDFNGPSDAAADPNAPDSSVWRVLKQATMAWWQHHPAQLAADVGRPLLNNYAREKPYQLLALAASAGAIAVVAKPWRLVSVTGLAVAALRSTRLSNALLGLIPRAAAPSDPHTTHHS